MDEQKILTIEHFIIPHIYSIYSSYGMSTSSLTVSSTTITTPKSPSYSTQYLCLLASEIVHLMCLVPVFFDYLDSNTGKGLIIRELL